MIQTHPNGHVSITKRQNKKQKKNKTPKEMDFHERKKKPYVHKLNHMVI